LCFDLGIAMFNRSRKQSDPMTPYYMVIGGFCGICVLAILYTVF